MLISGRCVVIVALGVASCWPLPFDRSRMQGRDIVVDAMIVIFMPVSSDHVTLLVIGCDVLTIHLLKST